MLGELRVTPVGGHTPFARIRSLHHLRELSGQPLERLVRASAS